MRKILLTTAMIVWSGLQLAMAQGRPIKGQIRDEKGEGVPGASVQVKDGKGGTTSDADGNFSLEVPDGKDVLIVNALGYGTQEVKAGDGDNAITVKLTTKDNVLDEAVVVGYGTEKKKDLIGGASIVDAEAFDHKAIGSFTNMLQGKAPGVQVTGSDGAPGSNAFVTIRGIGSLSGGTGPLYVIDGIPATVDAYSALNPEDIDNVSVLKDASTTAIYGSRGSNGVIMVTTKRGSKSGTPEISIGFQYGFKNKTNDNFKMMSFDQKLAFERQLGYTNKYLTNPLKNDGYSSIDEAPDPSVYWDLLRPYQTDWFKTLLRTGRVSQTDFAIRGNSDRINYSISFQNYSEDGISVGSNFVRRDGGLAVEYKVNDWIKIGEVAAVSYSTSQNTRDISNAQNPFAAIYLYEPYESPYDFTSSGYHGYNRTTQTFNVIEGLQYNPSTSGTLYGRSASYIELKPFKNITLKSQVGLQYSDVNSEYFIEPGSLLDYVAVSRTPTGQKRDNGSNRFNFVWTNTAEYKKTFGEMHNFKALIGSEYTNENAKSYSLTSKGFPVNPEKNTQDNGATPLATSTSRQAWTLMSYFGRAEYNYGGKYYINGSLRTDASSRFGANNRWGTFGAIGLAWNISEESFIPKNKTLNFLKLWASIGTSGSDGVGNYNNQALYNYGAYNNLQASFPYVSGPGNTNLTWEKNANGSIGVDFAMFKNRLTGTIDYYIRNTTSLLLDVPLSSTVGYSSQLSNAGGMRNSGFEAQANYAIIQSENLFWSVGGNITLNKNRVTKLVDDQDIVDVNSALNYFSVGKPFDVYFMQKSAGIDASNGDELWYRADGTKTNDYNEAGEFILDNKSLQPTYYGGVNTFVSYKGLGLSVDFYYSGGNYIYNQRWQNLTAASNAPKSNLATEALNSWSPTNTNAPNPIADINVPQYISDRFLQKGDFIRLRSLSLSYDFPVGLISKIKMKGLRFYLQGTNLWYHASEYKGDPEVGIGSKDDDYTRNGNLTRYAYPQTKAVTFGAKVTF